MSTWEVIVLASIVVAIVFFAVITIGGVLLLAGRRADAQMERMDFERTDGAPHEPKHRAG